MRPRLREHWKLVVLAIAMIVGAVTMVTLALTDRPAVVDTETEQFVVDTSLGDRPEQAWSLAVRRLTDNSGDVLLSMPYSLDTYHGYGGVLDAGQMLIAAVANPLADNGDQASGRPVGAVTLVGVNPADGSAAWKTRIGNVSQCSQQVEAVVLSCWAGRRVLFVDTASGKLLSEMGTDFDVNGAQVVDDTVYVSGTEVDRDAGRPVLTSGTVTDISANFRRTFEAEGEYPSVYAVPATDSVIATARGNGDPQYVYTVYDLATGTKRFTFGGDSLQPVGDGMFLASRGGRSGTVGTQDLLAADGALIRAVPIPAYSAASYPSKPSVPAPLFLGDGAYDPATGAERWRSPALVKDESAGRDTALAAVVGRAALVTSPQTRTITGLDLESGRELWQTPWQDAYWIRDGLTDGEHFVFGDYTGIHSIRARDGKIMWSLPLPDGADPRHVRVSSAGGSLMVSVRDQFTFWR
ncbi:PQQ-binding-like beta-propeller repeat protein [Rhodococcus sp. NPDC058514]|uniref:outer membrane protein assembly factor BamB family protein n=1 Tax=unclassified Rhodococcus (in: high G+C Gram-positive bacteria) TaxID=192944 RepID=UPI003667F70A